MSSYDHTHHTIPINTDTPSINETWSTILHFVVHLKVQLLSRRFTVQPALILSYNQQIHMLFYRTYFTEHTSLKHDTGNNQILVLSRTSTDQNII